MVVNRSVGSTEVSSAAPVRILAVEAGIYGALESWLNKVAPVTGSMTTPVNCASAGLAS